MYIVELMNWCDGILIVNKEEFENLDHALHFAKHHRADKVKVYDEVEILLWEKNPGRGDYA
jgi:hypothetical protein